MKNKVLIWMLDNIMPGKHGEEYCKECEKALEDIHEKTQKKEPFSITFRPDYNSEEKDAYWHIETQL